MRIAAILFAAGLLGVPEGAMACPTLKPAVQRRLDEARAAALLSADRIVVGRWIEVETSADGAVTKGLITIKRNGKDATIDAIASNEWMMCSNLIPNPGDGRVGRFYLNRIGPSTYGIFHFEPEVRRRMPARP